MGMFDSVNVPCPKCGALVEFQSKAGECTLEQYRLDTAPARIIGDISQDRERCPNCKSVVALRVQCVALPYITPE